MNKQGQLISLRMLSFVLVALLLWGIMFLWVQEKSDSSAYFQEFQAKDMALLSEVITASPGELTVSYTNVKQNTPLAYEFRKGVVQVDIVQNENGLVYEKSFGVFTQLSMAEKEFGKPAFLAFTLQNNKFAVKEDPTYKSGCTFTGDFPETSFFWEANTQFVSGAQEVFDGINKQFDESSFFNTISGRKVIFNQQGFDEFISIQHGGEDAEYLGCVLEEQIKLRIGEQVKRGMTTQDAIIITAPEKYDAGEIGRAFGHAVVVYANQ